MDDKTLLLEQATRRVHARRAEAATAWGRVSVVVTDTQDSWTSDRGAERVAVAVARAQAAEAGYQEALDDLRAKRAHYARTATDPAR